jgi:hypothetical protein
MDFRLLISTEAIGPEKFTIQFQKAHLYQRDEFRRPAILLARAMDLHGHEADNRHLARVWPDESKK